MLGRIFGDPAMMQYVGQVETPEQVRQRHRRYLTGDNDILRMFAILAGPQEQAAGLIGFWEHDAQGKPVYEMGWCVLPEFQGKGIATRAALLAVELVRREHKFRHLHAYAAVDNVPSNAVCRKAGFELLGQVVVDSPPAPQVPYNDWSIDLGE